MSVFQYMNKFQYLHILDNLENNLYNLYFETSNIFHITRKIVSRVLF